MGCARHLERLCGWNERISTSDSSSLSKNRDPTVLSSIKSRIQQIMYPTRPENLIAGYKKDLCSIR